MTTETTTSEHEIRADLVKVRTGVTATTGDAWRAVCTCGWKGEEHTHPSSALFDGERHIGPRQTVSEVPGQPGRVTSGPIQHWSSDSGTPDPITRKPALFPTFPSDNEGNF